MIFQSLSENGGEVFIQQIRKAVANGAGSTGRLLLIALLSAALIAGNWAPTLDSTAIEHVEKGLNRALVTYASSRTLNAVISAAQHTEVVVHPVGVGVSLAPGQVLDPINDIVERFSSLMLLASVSFGIQKLLIGVSSHILFQTLLSISVLAWAISACCRMQHTSALRSVLVLMVLLRFAVPVSSLGADLVFERFLADSYRTSAEYIDQSARQMEELHTEAEPQPAPPDGDSSWWEKLKQMGRDQLHPGVSMPQWETMQARFSAAVEHVINLIAIFILQTLILPLLLIYLIYAGARLCMRTLATPRTHPAERTPSPQ